MVRYIYCRWLYTHVRGLSNSKANNQRTWHLTLGELILKIEPIVEKQKERILGGSEEATVCYDFEYLFPTEFDSWRGSYNELALNFHLGGYGGDDKIKQLTVSKFLTLLKETVGKEFTGWKGGEFTMNKHTPIWVANSGNSGSTAIIDVVDNGYQIYLITAIREF